ncbi:hypothetical protein [Flavobacterium lipolyticum]|uniref:DUF4760 domain-containing protein n=1 Tax=Flavobacterium lipolyticum TaxID=2893754 RepID=A0ABS8LWP6_9FLAO|nr:hypothetical protein [Flavobacterium sp. F-126]MCC9016978.1 hypothetical protein [Flavobacterium sp. F-126]
MEGILKDLLEDWKLDTWANVLEIVGFTISIFSLCITILLKSEITKLKIGYIFDKTIKKHITKLSESTTNINTFFNDYNSNIRNIQLELSKCKSELQDLKSKLGFFDSLKSQRLIWFINSRLGKTFENEIIRQPGLGKFLLKYIHRTHKTTSEDVWVVYFKIHEIIRQVENIKNNKDKSL